MGGWVPPAVQIPQVPQVPACACCQGCHQCFPFLTWGRDAMAADQRFRNLYICIYIWLLVLYSYRIFIPIHELILPVDLGLQPQEALSIFDIWDTKKQLDKQVLFTARCYADVWGYQFSVPFSRSVQKTRRASMRPTSDHPKSSPLIDHWKWAPPWDQHRIVHEVPRWFITKLNIR